MYLDLFEDASNADCVAPDGMGILECWIGNEEEVAAYFEVIFCHSPGGNEERHKISSGIVDVPAEVRSRNLHNSSKKPYDSSEGTNM